MLFFAYIYMSGSIFCWQIYIELDFFNSVCLLRSIFILQIPSAYFSGPLPRGVSYHVLSSPRSSPPSSPTALCNDSDSNTFDDGKFHVYFVLHLVIVVMEVFWNQIDELYMGFQDVSFLPPVLVFAPHFLKIVVVVNALGLPHFLELWMGVSMDLLPLKYFCSNMFFLCQLSFLRIMRLSQH